MTMASYRVQMSWTDARGPHQPGDSVDLTADNPADQAEIDRLVSYGILSQDKTDEDATKTAKSDARK